jgi:hypothetical protein
MDKKIAFTIVGDPVPYLRMTQGQLKLLHVPTWKISPQGLKTVKRIRRYFSYKDDVRLAARVFKFSRRPESKIYLNVFVYFRNRKHADPENIRKGIQDSLFEQDNKVAGSVDFGYDPKNPRVEVEIIESE